MWRYRSFRLGSERDAFRLYHQVAQHSISTWFSPIYNITNIQHQHIYIYIWSSFHPISSLTCCFVRTSTTGTRGTQCTATMDSPSPPLTWIMTTGQQAFINKISAGLIWTAFSPQNNLTDRLHKDLVTEQNLSWNIFQGWRVCREKLCPIVQGELFCDCRHKSGCLLIVLTTPMTMQWLCTRWQSDTGWLVVRQLPWRKLERWVTAPPSEQLKSYKTDKLLPCPLPHPLTSIYHLGQSFVPQLGKFQTTQVYYGTVSNNSCWNIHWF